MDPQELQDPEKVSTIWVKFEQDHEQNEQYSIVDDWHEA